MIGLLLVDGTNRADVDTKDENYSEKDMKYPTISHIGLYLDNKYLVIDIYYPFSNQ